MEEEIQKIKEEVMGEKPKKLLKKNTFKYLGRLVFVLITAVAVYSSYQLYVLKKPDYQQQAAKKQTEHIIAAVSKLIEIPSDTPQIATVADVDTLKKTQPFFEKAQNGDQVLVFQNEAILFRESMNKIINVAAVTRNTAPAVTTQPTTPTPDTTTPAKTTDTTKTTTKK